MEVSEVSVMGVPQVKIVKETKLLVRINGKTNGLGYPYFRTRPYIPINQGLQPGDD
jgi:hypothetical protein